MDQQPSPFTIRNSEYAQCTCSIDAGIEHLIGDRLRRDFAHIIDEPLPDCFIELLDNIGRAEEAPGTNTAPIMMPPR